MSGMSSPDAQVCQGGIAAWQLGGSGSAMVASSRARYISISRLGRIAQVTLILGACREDIVSYH